MTSPECTVTSRLLHSFILLESASLMRSYMLSTHIPVGAIGPLWISQSHF